jgi:two-component system, OmpR family, response regulator
MAHKKKLIYVVDDDALQVQMISDHLKTLYDFDIRGFATGEEAVNNLPNHPDVVILDYFLNSVKASARNGGEILQFIKKEFPAIQVIMLSGQDSLDVAVGTMKYGAADYIVKGEQQFVRLEHSLEKILAQERLHARVAYYRRLSIISVVVLSLIVLVTLILSLRGNV